MQRDKGWYQLVIPRDYCSQTEIYMIMLLVASLLLGRNQFWAENDIIIFVGLGSFRLLSFRLLRTNLHVLFHLLNIITIGYLIKNSS